MKFALVKTKHFVRFKF